MGSAHVAGNKHNFFHFLLTMIVNIPSEGNSCITSKDEAWERAGIASARNADKELPTIEEFLVRKRSAPRVVPKCCARARTIISF